MLFNALAWHAIAGSLVLSAFHWRSASAVGAEGQRAAEIHPDGRVIQSAESTRQDVQSFTIGLRPDSVATSQKALLLRREDVSRSQDVAPGLQLSADVMPEQLGAKHSSLQDESSVRTSGYPSAAPEQSAPEPVNPHVDLFDCSVSFGSWMFSWSRAKMEWCCRYKDRGCPPTSRQQDQLHVTEPCTTVDCLKFASLNFTGASARFTGMQVCPGHGFTESACSMLGCCIFDAVNGNCHSAIGNGPCIMNYDASGKAGNRHSGVDAGHDLEKAIAEENEAFKAWRGTDVCEKRQYNGARCASLPCCTYDAATETCHSAVGSALCGTADKSGASDYAVYPTRLPPWAYGPHGPGNKASYASDHTTGVSEWINQSPLAAAASGGATQPQAVSNWIDSSPIRPAQAAERQAAVAQAIPSRPMQANGQQPATASGVHRRRGW